MTFTFVLAGGLAGVLCLPAVSGLFAVRMVKRATFKSNDLIAFLSAAPLPILIGFIPLWYVVGIGPFTEERCEPDAAVGCGMFGGFALFILFGCLAIWLIGMAWAYLTIFSIKSRDRHSRSGISE